MNNLTGRNVDGNSPLPDEAVVAMTLLAGSLPCLVCGEPRRDAATVLCLGCNDHFSKVMFTGGFLDVKKARSFKDYRDMPGRPDWFMNTRFGRPLTPKEMWVQRQEGSQEYRRARGERKPVRRSDDSKSTARYRKPSKPRAKVARES